MSAFNAGPDADSRLILLSDWLGEHCGEKPRRIAPASVDASFRRYYRVWLRRGTRIAMDAPPDREPLGPYLDVAARLRRVGVCAPEVFAADRRLGFVLMSDLGDQTYLAALETGADPAPLYGDAIHVLVTLQSRLDGSDLPAYDGPFLRQEMALFHDWLLDRHLGIRLSGADAGAWEDTVTLLCDAALGQPRVFVHRDYHSRNLMTGPPGAPGVLDFQDAMYGPLCYDLVSLLRDCYIDWPATRIDGWVRQYLELARQTNLAETLTAWDDERFRRAFDLMGVQRHLKASGIFARLNHRDGKPGYLGDVPRTLGHILNAVRDNDDLTWLARLIRERVLPELATGGAACGQ